MNNRHTNFCVKSEEPDATPGLVGFPPDLRCFAFGKAVIIVTDDRNAVNVLSALCARKHNPRTPRQ